MLFSEVRGKLVDRWESIKKVWNDEKAEEYRSGCIEPAGDILEELDIIQKKAISIIEEFDQKIKNYE